MLNCKYLILRGIFDTDWLNLDAKERYWREEGRESTGLLKKELTVKWVREGGRKSKGRL